MHVCTYYECSYLLRLINKGMKVFNLYVNLCPISYCSSKVACQA